MAHKGKGIHISHKGPIWPIREKGYTWPIRDPHGPYGTHMAHKGPTWPTREKGYTSPTREKGYTSPTREKGYTHLPQGTPMGKAKGIHMAQATRGDQAETQCSQAKVGASRHPHHMAQATRGDQAETQCSQAKVGASRHPHLTWSSVDSVHSRRLGVSRPVSRGGSRQGQTKRTASYPKSNSDSLFTTHFTFIILIILYPVSPFVFNQGWD